MDIGEISYRTIGKFYRWLEKNRLYTNDFEFDNRKQNSENLLLVVAGYQPYYWEEVFNRIQYSASLFEEDIDICVCIPMGKSGLKSDLQKRCSDLGWSCLYIKKDLLSQVQNVAIRLHPKADFIFKIDEDILLCENYFTRLKNAYINAERKTPYPIGFMGPLININAYGSYAFLHTIGEIDNYEKKFGKYEVFTKEDDSRNKIHKSPEVALFLWEKTIPFDETANKIKMINKDNFSICPVRFSIGAIAFKRSFWDDLGGFEVGKYGAMGVEEVQVCSHCINNFMPIFVAEDVFVGHLGFYTQKESCKSFFFENYEHLRLRVKQT